MVPLEFCFAKNTRCLSQGAVSPLPLPVAAEKQVQTIRASKIPPSLPTAIGERYSQNILNMWLLATLRWCELPYKQNAELTQSALFISHNSETFVRCTYILHVFIFVKIESVHISALSSHWCWLHVTTHISCPLIVTCAYYTFIKFLCFTNLVAFRPLWKPIKNNEKQSLNIWCPCNPLSKLPILCPSKLPWPYLKLN